MMNITMGLDDKKQKCFNRNMATDTLLKTLQQGIEHIFTDRKNRRTSPEELEREAFSANMRGQFLLLKKKGLPIRISSL